MSSYQAYQCMGELGKGSYGAVTKNRHILTGDVVAIKCFMADRKDFANVKRNVMVEANALREIVHENVVRLFHIFVENSMFYLVFEFVDRTLLDVIRAAPKKLLGAGRRTKSFAFQLLRAISFVHAHSYIHRDVKPENLLISNENILKLADFGFTTKMSYAGQRYSTYIATRWYRAPELLTGDVFYGKGVDIWAIGAVIVEMILGQPMAAGEEDLEQMMKTIELVGPFPRYMMDHVWKSQGSQFENKSAVCLKFSGLEELLKGQPVSFKEVIKSCLEPDPQHRCTAETILRHNLFVKDEPQFIPDILAKIKQSAAMNNKASAISYQMFLRKQGLYCKVAKEMMLHPETLGSINLSKYRQLGLSEHVIRIIAEIVLQEGKIPCDFLSQNPDLYESHREESSGDTSLYLPNIRPLAVPSHQPTIIRASGSPFRFIAPVQSRQPPVHPVFFSIKSSPPAHVRLMQKISLSTQSSNPWDNFSIRKTFPTRASATTIYLEPKHQLLTPLPETNNRINNNCSSRLSFLKDQLNSKLALHQTPRLMTSHSDQKCNYTENNKPFYHDKSKLPKIVPTFAQYMSPLKESVDAFGDGLTNQSWRNNDKENKIGKTQRSSGLIMKSDFGTADQLYIEGHPVSITNSKFA